MSVVIILAPGIQIKKNAKTAYLPMFSTSKEGNVFVLKTCLEIPAHNVCNVLHLAIGNPIKEDAYNVPTNRFTIE